MTQAVKDLVPLDADPAAEPASDAPPGRRRWALRLATFALLFVSAACLAAPWYAEHVARTTPNQGGLGDSIVVHGREVKVVSSVSSSIDAKGNLTISPGGQPIGPQWFAANGRYVLGADPQGRDVAVRLLYGGRLSLAIGILAAGLCIAISAALALLGGLVGGWLDATIGRILDVIWSLPWILLSLAIGTSVAVGGFDHFGIHLGPGSFPLVVAMLTYGPIPYFARALRARVLVIRDAEFVRAARLSGAGTRRIVVGELLPNITALLPAMFALDFANVLLGESVLTYLGVGVQPPTASWGSMIADGQSLLSSAPWLTLLPAGCIVTIAVSLNVLGEGLRNGSFRIPRVLRRAVR